ncbi:MAG: ErfK/YbiS/YcfS/YnhG family [Beijerinckiaceae bacterium]|nr:MAG: ErfK/YbiS/YcfS/YnhG family [Beijerinckiaceae bacterium]
MHYDNNSLGVKQSATFLCFCPAMHTNIYRFIRPAVALGLCLVAAACNYSSFPDPTLSSRDVELLALAPKSLNRDLDPARARFRLPNPTSEKKAGTVVVDSAARFLYLIEEGGTALRYEISPGQDAHQWSGTATIGRKVEWPTWTPGTTARQMVPGLPGVVPGGPNNPLGARGLYLHDEKGRDTEYRIHGTNEPEMIGQPVSLGCIRMHNIDAIDLYNRVKIGAKVVVL